MSCLPVGPGEAAWYDYDVVGGGSDRPHVRFGRTVRPNPTVWFGTNDITFFCRTQNFFFVLHSMPMASFHIFVLLSDPHVRSVIIGL
jgi:hypothetical protein